MDLYDAIAARTSVRAFKSDPIDRETLTRIVATGNSAPISRFTRLAFSVVEGRFLMNKLDAAVHHEVTSMGLADHAPVSYSYGAPVMVIVSTQATEDDILATAESPSDIASAATAIENICLAAVAEGLGSCLTISMMLGLKEGSDILREQMGIPKGYSPLMGVLLGYTDEPTPINRHRDSSNIFFSEK